MTAQAKNTLRTALLSTLFAAVLTILSVHTVQAQLSGPISGDILCGSSSSTKCGPQHLKQIGVKLLSLFVYLGSAALVVLVSIRLLWSVKAYFQGDVMAIKKAGEDAFNAFIGFIIIFAVGAGILLIMLKSFGVQPWAVKLLQFFSSGFIEHAYAAEERLLPNPLGSNSAYDLIIAALSLAMRFFIYPGLIVMWVAAGFKFIYSQGNPEGLKTARSWLLVSFIVTVVAFSLQGFILALKATAQKIVPTASIREMVDSESSRV